MSDICRLCLNKVNISKTNKSNYAQYKDKIKFIIPEIDFNITTTFTLCSDCTESVESAYAFKCSCIQVEELIKMHVTHMRATVLDLNDVIEQKFYVIEEESYNDAIMTDVTVGDFLEMESLNSEIVHLICDKCNQTFDDGKNYEEHKEKCIVYKSLDCGGILTEKQLETHKKSHSLPKLFLCNVCDKTYRRKSELTRHVSMHHSVKSPIICNLCDKTFSCEKYLEKHKLTHTDQKKQYICDICNNTYYKKYYLLQHKETHLNNKYDCTLCEKSFNVPLYLQRHMTNAHVQKHICETCGLKCSTKQNLVRHIRIHTGERPYKCEFCGKGFAQRGTFSIHMRSIHSTEKPFICETCGKAFSVMTSLRLHEVVHVENSEKNYVCAKCNNTFRTNRALRQHIWRHTASKKFKCSICDKDFLKRNDLQKHMRSHTGEKPYECLTCHKRFSQTYNLQIHIRSHRSKEKITK